MDKKIIEVIKKHHLMTLATVGGGGTPWVAHAFYAWVAELECFAFTTDPATRHGGEMTAYQCVAAGIALETRVVGKVQGIQIEGVAERAATDEGVAELADSSDTTAEAAARKAYFKRFPYATAMPNLTFWLLRPTSMKLTDNTLGFGTKLTWVAPDA